MQMNFNNMKLNKITPTRMRNLLNSSGHSIKDLASKLDISHITARKLLTKLGFNKKWTDS
jgi:predicted ArsR family transcriptional regulator